MTKKPAKPAWNSFTKAELIKTIKKLDARQTRLLNELAASRAGEDLLAARVAELERRPAVPPSFEPAPPMCRTVPTGAELDTILEARAPRDPGLLPFRGAEQPRDPGARPAFPWEPK